MKRGGMYKNVIMRHMEDRGLKLDEKESNNL